MKNNIKKGKIFIEIGYIYSIRNVVNDKVYIGATRQIKKRFVDHKRKLKKRVHENRRIQLEYNLYGENSFVYEIIETICGDRKYLHEKEQFYYDLYNSYNYQYGYNIGCVALNHVSIGEMNGMYGNLGEKAPTSKPVIQLSLDGEFIERYEGTRDVERKTGFDHSHISSCCLGKKSKAKNYIWMHEEDYNEENVKRRVEQSNNTMCKKPYRVVQLTLDGKFVKQYENCVDAFRKTGVAHQSVSSCCIGKKLTAGGYKWMKYDDYVNNKEEFNGLH